MCPQKTQLKQKQWTNPQSDLLGELSIKPNYCVPTTKWGIESLPKMKNKTKYNAKTQILMQYQILLKNGQWKFEVTVRQSFPPGQGSSELTESWI